MTEPVVHKLNSRSAQNAKSVQSGISLIPSSYDANPSDPASLNSAADRHNRCETASFHTPGHKGRLAELVGADWLCPERDLTELPGLDELAHPQSVLAHLENQWAELYGSGAGLLSVNGASAALMAAIMASRCLGQYILLPRNAHRSAVQAAAAAGLEPIWYEPNWQANWGFWGETDAQALSLALQTARSKNPTIKIAAALVVSPTYEGTISDIAAIAASLKSESLALIIDAAHGAHFLATNPHNAIACGADAVAHSLHKTLPGLTQTGLLHLSSTSKINTQSARAALNSLTSSSPSYLLLASIEHTMNYLVSAAGQDLSAQFTRLRRQLLSELSHSNEQWEIYQPASGNDSHILISCRDNAENLANYLAERGIYAEAILGKGLLFMLGAGTNSKDITLLATALNQYQGQYGKAAGQPENFPKPQLQIVLSPNETLTQAVVTLPREMALGKIAAECVCPCPPGIPVLIPGQKITEEVLERTENKQFTVLATPGLT